MSEKCPVCEHTVGDGATGCDNCGFKDDCGVDRVWVNPEDYNRWLETVVKPYRVGWERKQKEELQGQLAAAKKREAELLAQLEEAKNLIADAGKHKIISGGGTYFTDPRDGQVYRTVKIGGLVWMAQNLNYKIDGSWCYDDDESNGNKYGRLYTWEAAKNACPNGWHLPSREEWDKLVEAAGDQDIAIAGKKLKSKIGWSDYDGKSGNGTDEFGLSALPGGYRDSNGDFGGAGRYGYWWSATEGGSNLAYGRGMYYSNGSVGENTLDKSNGFSVRCVED